MSGAARFTCRCQFSPENQRLKDEIFPCFFGGGCLFFKVFPQIALAIGILTSNRGGGRRTTLADWTWHQGASAGCSGRGAIAGCNRRVPLLGAIGCHCSVLWLGGRVTTNFGGVDVVPLLGGAIVVCYGGGKVTANFGGVDVVPLLGASVGCHCSALWLGWRVTTWHKNWFLLCGVYAGVICLLVSGSVIPITQGCVSPSNSSNNQVRNVTLDDSPFLWWVNKRFNLNLHLVTHQQGDFHHQSQNKSVCNEIHPNRSRCAIQSFSNQNQGCSNFRSGFTNFFISKNLILQWPFSVFSGSRHSDFDVTDMLYMCWFHEVVMAGPQVDCRGTSAYSTVQLPSRKILTLQGTNSHIPPWGKEHHLEKCLGRGYVIVPRRVITQNWSCYYFKKVGLTFRVKTYTPWN